MTSNLSPSPLGDFVMLESHQIHNLPLRQRLSENEAEQDQDLESPSSDDDLEHISRPGSVRSLNTLSPSSSPEPVSAAEDFTAVSPLTIRASPTLSRHTQPSEDHHQAGHHLPAHDGSKTPSETLPDAAQVSTQPPSSSNTHATLDQEIMDYLIEHALNARIEQEYGFGSSKDKKLRQQMMTRFRSLPAEHSFVKDSISQLGGSKALFQGQERTPTELEYVYRIVFTDVERMAMNFLVESHLRHFETGCHLHGSFMPTARSQLYHAMEQPAAYQGRILAIGAHFKVFQNFGLGKPYKEPFVDLRKQTRSKLNSSISRSDTTHPLPVVSGERDGINAEFSSEAPTSFRSGYDIDPMQNILNDTIADLPNKRYSPDSPDISRSVMVSRAMKRESPEDDAEPSLPCVSPPLKKSQPDNSSLSGMVSSSSISPPTGNTHLVASSTPTRDQDMQSTSSQQTEYERTHSMPGTAHGRPSTDAEHQQRLHRYIQAQHQLREQQRKRQEAEQNQKPEQVKVEKLDEEQKPDTSACDRYKWTREQKSTYDFQLRILEQQVRRAKEEKKKSSKRPKVEKLDETSLKSEEDSMNIRSEQLRDDTHQVMANQTSQMKATDWRTFRPDWPIPNDHFSAQSQNVLAGAEGPAREYRQDTLLAQSTQLPIPPASGNRNEVQPWNSQLSPVGNEPSHIANSSSASENTRGYFAAPPSLNQDSGMTINDWRVKTATLEANARRGRNPTKNNNALRDYQMQLLLLEEAKIEQERRKISPSADKSKPKPRSAAQVPSNPPSDHQEAISTKSSQESAEKPIIWTDDLRAGYQMQLMLLEQQNKQSRFKRREEEERQRSIGDGDKGSSSDQSGRNQPVASGAREVKTPQQVDYEKQLKALEEANKKRLMLQKMAEHPQQVDYEKQLKALEEANKQRLMLKHMTERRQQEVSDVTTHMGHQMAQDRAAPIRKYGLGAVTLEEYHQKLMEQERLKMVMITRQRELDERDRLANGFSTPTFAPAHQNRNLSGGSPYPIVRKDGYGICWMAFEYTKDGVKMEYTVRCDIESVDTDMLPWFFKDVNCLWQWCEGWESTAQRKRRAQIAFLGVHFDQGDNSGESMRQRLADNKIAWSLAQLNPCLRMEMEGTGTKDLLWNAVIHFKTSQQSLTESGKQKSRESDNLPGPSRDNAGPSKDPFILQSPDEIMNDANLEESSSEDDDEECRHMDDQMNPDSEFPTRFVDDQGKQYLTFEFHSRSTGSTDYYTVRIDDVEQAPHIGRPFWLDGCICQEEWKQQQATTIHCRDCNIAIALNRLNPILQGKENEKLRWAAMSNYVLMNVGDRRPSKLGGKYQLYNGSDGDGPLLNPVVLQKDVEDGYILFMRQPYTGEPGAQCRQCNVILGGIGYGDRVIHLARCDGYERKGKIRM